MKTIVISSSQTLDKFEGEDVLNTKNFSEALKYINTSSKGTIEKIIIKDLPEDGMNLTAILKLFIENPTLIHNIILYLTDIHIEYDEYQDLINNFKETTGSKVKFGQIEEKKRRFMKL